MNHLNKLKLVFVLIVLFSIQSCNSTADHKVSDDKVTNDAHEIAFLKVLQSHLQAVSDRNLSALEKTLSPNGNMELILPKSKITTTSKEFLDMHRAWFKDTTWTFETKILNSSVHKKYGIATVEALYKEPDRDGVPYFNRMAVSYVLENIEGSWYVVKEHACSLEKSTD